MTRSMMRMGRGKATVAAFAILMAAAALAVLGTTSVNGGRSAFDRTVGSASLDQGHLGR